MTIRVTKTITQDTTDMVQTKSTPTGWARYDDDTGDWISCPPPITLPYRPGDSAEERGFQHGHIHTSVSADAPVTVTLTPRQIEVVLSTFLTSKVFIKGFLRDRPTPAQVEAATELKEVLANMGVPEDFIVRDEA